jgi:enamine deaminase RidA (YjgF/YER057c/UK114 family)
MTVHETLDPAGWKPARGYANGIAATGRTLFLGGMIGWNGQQEFESDDFVDQAAQALRNIVEVLAVAGAGPEHLVRLTSTSLVSRTSARRTARSSAVTTRR